MFAHKARREQKREKTKRKTKRSVACRRLVNTSSDNMIKEHIKSYSFLSYHLSETFTYHLRKYAHMNVLLKSLKLPAQKKISLCNVALYI